MPKKYENAVTITKVEFKPVHPTTISMDADTTFHKNALTDVLTQATNVKEIRLKMGRLKNEAQYWPLAIAIDTSDNEMVEAANKVALPCPDYCGGPEG